MADMKVCDSNEWSFSFSGISIDSGRGEEGGDFLKISYDKDAFTDVVSLDGEVTRGKTNDQRATIELIVMSSSSSNAVLSALHIADKKAANGAGIGAVLARDGQGTSTYAGAKAWIIKHPDINVGEKVVPLTWKIRVASLESFTGGN